MTRRALPVGLVLAAAAADVRELHELAFYLLVAAVPAMAVSALWFFGDLVDMPGGSTGETAARLHAFFAALALVLTVVAAAARGQSALERGVPPLGISALVGCLIVLTMQGLVTLAAAARRGAPGVSAAPRDR
jgi:cytochrome b